MSISCVSSSLVCGACTSALDKSVATFFKFAADSDVGSPTFLLGEEELAIVCQ